MGDDVLTLAVVGAGSWGKNLVRNFATAKRCRLKYVCDLDEALLAKQKLNFPTIETTTDLGAVLADGEVAAVAVSTEAPTHFEIVTRALEAGKHTYVEKPLTLKSDQAKKLVKQAEKAGLKLMVGHLLEYHPAVEYLKTLIDDNRLGTPYYMYTQRVNLGIVRQNENAWMSLAPHDISIICHLLGSDPIAVTAHGQCYLQKNVEDVVFATIRFADGKVANVHCSWLDPHKIRKMTIVGSEKMVTFDDMEATEKIRIYDKTAAVTQNTETFADVVSLRFGDIVIPRIRSGEPLALECAHFIEAVLDDKPIRSDGADGLRVVQILEAGLMSLRNNGVPVNPEAF